MVNETCIKRRSVVSLHTHIAQTALATDSCVTCCSFYYDPMMAANPAMAAQLQVGFQRILMKMIEMRIEIIWVMIEAIMMGGLRGFRL